MKVPYILVDDYHPKWFSVIVEVTEHFINKEDFPYEMVKVFEYDSTGGDNGVLFKESWIMDIAESPISKTGNEVWDKTFNECFWRTCDR